MTERTPLGELARCGRLEVRTSEYRESVKGPAAAVTLFCADGSLLQVFSRGALDRDPERIREHQESVRARLGALLAQVRRWKRALGWMRQGAVFVAVGGFAWEIVRAVQSGDVRELVSVRSLVWIAAAGSLLGVRWLLQRWAQRALRKALQRWLGPDAPAITGSPRS